MTKSVRSKREKMARERVRAQLESDKRERHRKVTEEKKRLAQGIALPAHVTAAPAASNPLSNVSYSEARLNIGPNSFKLWQPFPRKMLGNNDLGKSLKDLCLVPSAALIAQ
ncbi:hypothetical protein BSLG_005791 [Batrachochytrium salamandrivorans]|nr:hypothetical protein BSLG_005791 [Batrachochytrium salamandrivorans]